MRNIPALKHFVWDEAFDLWFDSIDEVKIQVGFKSP